MGDFWADMSSAFVADSMMDDVIQGKELEGPAFTGVQALTDAGRAKKALRMPVDAGTRVRFVANLGSVLTYPDIPGPKVEGTVVTVRTGSGNQTSQDGRVFVLWDDGQFRSILAEHLRLAGVLSKRAQTMRMVVADLGDITAFFTPTAGRDELVHKATKDLWAFRQTGGQYVIERLFDDTGKPLKV